MFLVLNTNLTIVSQLKNHLRECLLPGEFIVNIIPKTNYEHLSDFMSGFCGMAFLFLNKCFYLFQGTGSNPEISDLVSCDSNFTFQSSQFDLLIQQIKIEVVLQQRTTALLSEGLLRQRRMMD